MMSAMAEDERLRIIKRTHEGRQIARAKGVRMGRKPKLTPHQIKEALPRLLDLVRGEFRLTPHPDALGASNLSAFVGALDDPQVLRPRPSRTSSP